MPKTVTLCRDAGTTNRRPTRRDDDNDNYYFYHYRERRVWKRPWVTVREQLRQACLFINHHEQAKNNQTNKLTPKTKSGTKQAKNNTLTPNH